MTNVGPSHDVSHEPLVQLGQRRLGRHLPDGGVQVSQALTCDSDFLGEGLVQCPVAKRYALVLVAAEDRKSVV